MMDNYKKSGLIKWQSGKVKGFNGIDLLEEKNGGVKLVKVDALAAYPSHLHPDKTEYVYVLEGTPTITIGGSSQVGERGDFFTLPPSIKHSIVNQTEDECLLLVGAIQK